MPPEGGVPRTPPLEPEANINAAGGGASGGHTPSNCLYGPGAASCQYDTPGAANLSTEVCYPPSNPMLRYIDFVAGVRGLPPLETGCCGLYQRLTLLHRVRNTLFLGWASSLLKWRILGPPMSDPGYDHFKI